MIADKIYGFFYRLFNLKIFRFKFFNVTPSDIAEFIYKKYCSYYHNLEEIVGIKINDQIQFKIQCNASRGYTDIKLIWDKIYEKDITHLFLGLIDSQDVVIDIGANIGYYTIMAAKSLLKNGECHAFEPVLSTFNILNRNIELNNLTNVKSYRIAGGSEKAVLDINISKESGLNSIVRKKRIQKKTPTQSIIVDRIDNILKIKNKEVLIKIDTEGYEFETIKGLTNIIERNRCKVILEYSPSFYGFFNQKIFIYCNDFLHYLMYKGFIIYEVGINGTDSKISDIESFIKIKGRRQTTLLAINNNVENQQQRN
jgi:FkbM family methyltransferase